MLQEEHERVSETGVFPLLDRVSGTLSLLHYVTETSHLYSLKTFEDSFVCLGLRRIVTVACIRRVQIFLLTYLLTTPCVFSSNVMYSVCMHSTV